MKNSLFLFFNTPPVCLGKLNHVPITSIYFLTSEFLSPATFRKLQAFQVSNEFKKVTKVVSVDLNDMVSQIKPNNIIVKNFYVGINASDVNFTNGKYIPGIKP